MFQSFSSDFHTTLSKFRYQIEEHRKKSMSKSINRERFLFQAKEKRKSRLYFMYIPCDQNCSSCFTHVHIESQQSCEIFCLHYGDEESGIQRHVLTGQQYSWQAAHPRIKIKVYLILKLILVFTAQYFKNMFVYINFYKRNLYIYFQMLQLRSISIYFPS